MDFGVEFIPDNPINEVVEKAKVADETGFDYIWITDHYNNRNVYSTLSLIAEETEQITLGPGVTNPYTVHPAETASSIATISEISGGRAVLGIGAGDRTILEAIGLKWDKPLTRTEETIQIIRELLDGKEVSTEKMERHKIQKAKLNFKPKEEIRIFVGAQGPNMLQMAGKRGDGILINASHPKDFDFAMEQIKKGVEISARNLDEIEVAAYTSFSVAEDTDAAMEAATQPVAFIVAGVSEVVLDRHGIPLEHAQKIGKALNKREFGKAFGSVTNEMVDAFALYGNPELKA